MFIHKHTNASFLKSFIGIWREFINTYIEEEERRQHDCRPIVWVRWFKIETDCFIIWDVLSSWRVRMQSSNVKTS